MARRASLIPPGSVLSAAPPQQKPGIMEEIISDHLVRTGRKVAVDNTEVTESQDTVQSKEVSVTPADNTDVHPQSRENLSSRNQVSEKSRNLENIGLESNSPLTERATEMSKPLSDLVAMNVLIPEELSWRMRDILAQLNRGRRGRGITKQGLTISLLEQALDTLEEEVAEK